MIYFLFSIMMYLVQNFSNKQFGRNAEKSSDGISLVQNGICTFSAAVCLAVFGKAELMPVGMMLWAALFSVFYLLTVFLLLKAFQSGSMGNSTMLCNIGMFLSAVYGVIRFGDDFSLLIILGGLCFLGTVILSTPKKEKGEKNGVKWFLYALGSGVANGAVGALKRETVAIYGGNIQNFLMWSFLFAAAIACILILVDKTKRTDAVIVLKKRSLLLCGVFAGVGTAGANLFQMKALLTVPSTIVYPFTAGALVVLLWLASWLLYKEVKLKMRNVLSLILCVAAILLISFS